MSDDLAPIVHEAQLVDESPVGYVRVLVLANVFSLERFERRIPEGQTLGEIVRGLGLPGWQSALVAIDGEAIPRQVGRTVWWDLVRPKAGHVVTVRAIPRGGGGGGDKAWIGIAAGVLLVAIGVVLAIATWGALSPFAVPLIVMGVGLIAGGVITLVFPPPGAPKLKSGSGSDAPVFSLTGTRNIADPYGAITRVFGRHQIFLATFATCGESAPPERSA
jgi:hypothetical protein